jgi:hypothetical protein
MELFSKAEACGCNKWNCPICRYSMGDRDGSTYDRGLDLNRLNAQSRRVYDVMVKGDWMTLRMIADQTGDPEASVSARLRDFRKDKFGGLEIQRKRDDNGLHWYRLQT